MLIPNESANRIHEIRLESANRVGEFTAKLRPSDCLTLINTYSELCALVDEAHLNGKDEI